MKRRNKRHIDGYVILTNGMLEHRYVMENYLGRKLTSQDIVHHINGDREDNELSNLELTNRSDHASLHHRGIPKPPRKTGWHQDGKWKNCICRSCGKEFGTYVSRQGIYCSRECAKETFIKKGQSLSPDTQFKIGSFPLRWAKRYV